MHALVLHLSFGGGSNATAAEQATTTIGRGRLSLFCASVVQQGPALELQPGTRPRLRGGEGGGREDQAPPHGACTV